MDFVGYINCRACIASNKMGRLSLMMSR